MLHLLQDDIIRILGHQEYLIFHYFDVRTLGAVSTLNKQFLHKTLTMRVPDENGNFTLWIWEKLYKSTHNIETIFPSHW